MIQQVGFFFGERTACGCVEEDRRSVRESQGIRHDPEKRGGGGKGEEPHDRGEQTRQNPGDAEPVEEALQDHQAGENQDDLRHQVEHVHGPVGEQLREAQVGIGSDRERAGDAHFPRQQKVQDESPDERRPQPENHHTDCRRTGPFQDRRFHEQVVGDQTHQGENRHLPQGERESADDCDGRIDVDQDRREEHQCRRSGQSQQGKRGIEKRCGRTEQTGPLEDRDRQGNGDHHRQDHHRRSPGGVKRLEDARRESGTEAFPSLGFLLHGQRVSARGPAGQAAERSILRSGEGGSWSRTLDYLHTNIPSGIMPPQGAERG